MFEIFVIVEYIFTKVKSQKFPLNHDTHGATISSFMEALLLNMQWMGLISDNEEQAEAELGQAQLQLELGFTLIKVCRIILMITNYHYISNITEHK